MTDSTNGFQVGEFITGERDGEICHAVVLDKNSADGSLLLLWLSDNQCAEIGPAELQGWGRGVVPDARWVEVYKGGAEEPFFAGYLPTFQAALSVYQTFEKRDGIFRVEIFTASEYEDHLIDEVIDPQSARGYS